MGRRAPAVRVAAVVRQAYDTCPDDPAVCHELGVLMYKCGQLAAAVMWFDKALNLLPGGRPTLRE